MDALSADVLLETQEGGWMRQEPGLPGAARRAAAALADRIRMDARRAAEVGLAVTEVATNLMRHASDGAVLLRTVSAGSAAGVELLALDNGPGMADPAAAMFDGVSSSGTLGLGLGSISRIADFFDIHSIPGRGTVLIARFWPVSAHRDESRGREEAVGGITRPLSGETVCGDAWAARIDPGEPQAAESDAPQAVLVMLCDGLGHGPLAALAAQQAVATFRASHLGEPTAILKELHGALGGTRGAALAVARIETGPARLVFCGVGNVSAFVIDGPDRAAMLSSPGIVGHHMPKTHAFEHALPARAAVVMHSDGLTERWDHSAAPGLLSHSPTLIAGYLLREAGVRRDDASVVVAKGLW